MESIILHCELHGDVEHTKLGKYYICSECHIGVLMPRIPNSIKRAEDVEETN